MNHQPLLLVDGSPPATPEDLFARLEELGIEVQTVHHPAVFTVEESKANRGELEGGHTKNQLLLNTPSSELAPGPSWSVY